jgi:hypothetical protein
MMLDVRLNGELKKAGFRIGVIDQSKAENTQSKFNIPAIGLKPKSANLPEQKAWGRAQIAKLRAEFGRVTQER